VLCVLKKSLESIIKKINSYHCVWLILTSSSDKLTEAEEMYGYFMQDNVTVRTEKLSMAVPAEVFGKGVIICRLLHSRLNIRIRANIICGRR